MRHVRILDAAALETAEAAAWYERERSGLGEEFIASIDAALDLLEADVVPLAAMPSAAGARGAKRLVLRRFPFDIIVTVGGDEELVVVAVAHHSRRPGFWRGRLPR